MIDASLPVEYERSDRMQAVSDGRREAMVLRPVDGLRPRLTVEEAAARREEGALELNEVEAVESVPAVAAVPADPDAALRHARIGFVAVAVLMLLLVWMMQRKKGS